MAKILDWFLNTLGVLLIGIIAWDCAKSPSGKPEGLLYLLARSPSFYPQEIEQVVDEKDAEKEQAIADKVEAISLKDQEIEQILEAKRQEIIEEIQNSGTGCISLAGLPNALCIGPRLDISE